MNKVFLFVILLLDYTFVYAQGYAGHGRGSDYTGSSGNPMSILYFILLVAAAFIIFFIYNILKAKFGKTEWSYIEFSRKHGPTVKCSKNGGDFVESLVFITPAGKQTFVILDWSCSRKYFDLDSVELDKYILSIKSLNGQYIMYKNKGR